MLSFRKSHVVPRQVLLCSAHSLLCHILPKNIINLLKLRNQASSSIGVFLPSKFFQSICTIFPLTVSHHLFTAMTNNDFSISNKNLIWITPQSLQQRYYLNYKTPFVYSTGADTCPRQIATRKFKQQQPPSPCDGQRPALCAGGRGAGGQRRRRWCAGRSSSFACAVDAVVDGGAPAERGSGPGQVA